jgi:hypothetical protein
MGSLSNFVIPDLHNFAWNTSLEILKGSFIESGCDWVLWSAHCFVVVLYVAGVEMWVEEFGIAEDAEYSMDLGPPMKKFMSHSPIRSGALSCHQSQKSEIDNISIIVGIIRNQVKWVQVYSDIREECKV